MKLLLDQNLSHRLCATLADLCLDIVHVRTLGLDQRPDIEIFTYAQINDFVIVTLDSDFAEMATVLRESPLVVWLRCGNQTTEFVGRKLREAWPHILALPQTESKV